MTDLGPAFSLLWIGWGALWLLAARWSARAVVRQTVPQRMRHLLPMLLGGALYLTGSPPDTLPGRWIVPPDRRLGWTGLALTIAGLGFAVWARLVLGRLWSGAVTLKDDHLLIRRGPYGITRHPIYSGLLLALLGTGLYRDTVGVGIGFLCIAAAILFKLRQEEQLLERHFGPAYEVYRREVRTLVPYVW
jgi:protein-S-isoprenylcysteine O-methyltransferase Ste14